MSSRGAELPNHYEVDAHSHGSESKDQLRQELRGEVSRLRSRLQEAEDILGAIQSGEVDAVVVTERQGEKVYTFRSPDRPYRLMIEAMRQGAATVARDGTLLYCNGCFAEMVGASAAGLVGTSLFPLVAPGGRDLLEALLAGHGKLHIEVELLAEGGGRIPVYLSVNTLMLDEEEPVLCLVVTDLTEQKRNEQIVADEKLARSILDHATEAMVVCDIEGRIVHANREAHRLCGQNVLLERFESAFPLELAGEIPGARSFVDLVLAGGRLRGVEASLEGGRLALALSAGPLLGADQRIEGCVVTLTDITERRRAERELERSRAEAEAMNEAKDHFLATLSHELRTPLTPVLAMISSLEENGRAPAELRSDLMMMRRNIELEARLIDDLLDLTRISRGKLELERQGVDLREVLWHAIQSSCHHRATGIRVEVDLGTGDHRLWGDAPRLTQVFWNLLNNAVKFTPQGGTIFVRSRCEADEIAVEVSDTGVGIEPELLPRIFDAFEQGGASVTRRFGGLGLGLAISKAIVEQHGGEIAVRSEGRGRGTTFAVRLPVGPRLAGTVEVPLAAAAEPRSLSGGLRILLVEDHADTAGALADLLEARGYRVVVAATYGDALAAAERAGPGGLDLVLSDLGLPDGTGQDLMRELARRYALRGIALSGYGMEEDIRKSREAGFDRHLTKPVNLQTLEAAIQTVAAGEPPAEA